MIEQLYFLGLSIYILGLLGFIFNRDNNLIMQVICLELSILGMTIILLSLSTILDDIVGLVLVVTLLPLAGCESAILLSLTIKYYPNRGTLIY